MSLGRSENLIKYAPDSGTNPQGGSDAGGGDRRASRLAAHQQQLFLRNILGESKMRPLTPEQNGLVRNSLNAMLTSAISQIDQDQQARFKAGITQVIVDETNAGKPGILQYDIQAYASKRRFTIYQAYYGSAENISVEKMSQDYGINEVSINNTLRGAEKMLQRMLSGEYFAGLHDSPELDQLRTVIVTLAPDTPLAMDIQAYLQRKQERANPKLLPEEQTALYAIKELSVSEGVKDRLIKSGKTIAELLQMAPDDIKKIGGLRDKATTEVQRDLDVVRKQIGN